MSIKKIVLLIILITSTFSGLFAQSDYSQQYLKNTFPKLFEIYENDLGSCRAHYVFVIDISGSMDQFESVVVPSIQAFIEALPVGDRVSIIPYGTEAKATIPGFCGTITENLKANLSANMINLYKNPNYSQSLKDHTDTYKAVKAMSNAFNTFRGFEVNIGIMMTDFLNNMDEGGHGRNNRKLTPSELAEMKKDYNSATLNTYRRVLALELHEKEGDNTLYKNYCLPQLRDSVFNETENGLEVQNTQNTSELIKQWFEQLRRDIQVVKLKAIIQSENKAGSVEMKTSIDIDGNTTAHIIRHPSRLYNMIRIDSSYFVHNGLNEFRFINDTTQYGATDQEELDITLGKIKHKDWCFHFLSDSIQLGISLPTLYDTELEMLGIDKPISNAASETNRWIFTFLLPFWLTCLICALLVAYIICVIVMFIRNQKDSLSANIQLKDSYDDPIDDKKIRQEKNFSIGESGNNNKFKVEDAGWSVQFTKQMPNPMCPFSKPIYKWTCSKGYVTNGKYKTGTFNNKPNTTINLVCGTDCDTTTHNVAIKIIGK